MSPFAHGRPGEVVYFVGAEGAPDRRVKIGRSRQLHLRIAQMALWSPYPLTILAEVSGGCRLERQLHILFEADRLHSEWFAWSPLLGEVIAQAKAGQLDHAALPLPLTERPRLKAAA